MKRYNKWKVYDIFLKEYEPFIFYKNGDKLVNICNKKFPRPHNGVLLWQPDNTFTRINNPKMTESITFPTWLAEKGDADKSLESQIPAYIDVLYQMQYFDGWNIFLIRKFRPDWYDEVAMGAWKAIGTKRNRKIEHLIKRIENLRVFS